MFIVQMHLLRINYKKYPTKVYFFHKIYSNWKQFWNKRYACSYESIVEFKLKQLQIVWIGSSISLYVINIKYKKESLTSFEQW